MTINDSDDDSYDDDDSYPTSCRIALVWSVILSNSSMQQMPLSDSTNAPDE